MPSIDTSALDIISFTRDLPLLIVETNLENQITNIKQWLDPLLPVHAIGIMINNTNNGDNTLAIGLEANDIRAITQHLANSADGIHDQSIGKPELFALGNGELSVSEAPDANGLQTVNGLALALKNHDDTFGTFWLVTEVDALSTLLRDEKKLRWFHSMVSNIIFNTWCHHLNQEKIRFLNLYETVSSSLCYAGDLHELLTSIISIIVSEIPSEEGSILLFNEETNQLEFFSAMGETGESFIQCCFPADKGVAGKALQEGMPVIVNNTETCPFFFGDFDDDSGFVTKSILAAPIIVGEEKVGVIEAINKVGSDCFEEADKRMLIAIADEVGLAVKNARMFDYVVDSYCMLRQGVASCKGCRRPLKSWTPCARQLELV